jgi:hypothetical protein
MGADAGIDHDLEAAIEDEQAMAGDQKLAVFIHEMRLQPAGMCGHGRSGLSQQHFRREGRGAFGDPYDLHIADLPAQRLFHPDFPPPQFFLVCEPTPLGHRNCQFGSP